MSVKRYTNGADDDQGTILPFMEESLDGDYVEYSDYAALLAEVERLNLNAYKHLSMRIEIDKLNAQIKRLCNAGDAMALAIEGDYNYPLPCVQAWNAAKESKSV